MAKTNALGAAKARIVTLEAALADEKKRSTTLVQIREQSREANATFLNDVQGKLVDAQQALDEYREENDRLQSLVNNRDERLIVQAELVKAAQVRINELKESKAKAIFWAISLACGLIITLSAVTGGLFN